MINLDDASTPQERLALEIFKAMDDGRIVEAIPELTSDDFVWSNSGLPDLEGQESVIELLNSGGFANEIPILAEMTHFTADLVHIASSGNTVFTERIDHHWAADGRDLMTPHICGVVEVRDGKIVRLHDFYDTACYRQEPTAPQAGFSLAERHPDRVWA
ncbi:MAG: limonene-1,2-epoxide hydrolase family protein [Erythrobacter sp.]|nr:limonene-1,2-epoxide hydrolase family protein [Erythrobacter sp.]